MTVRSLTEDEQKLFNKMLDTIHQKKRRNTLRSRYADSKRTLQQVGISIPPEMQDFQAVLGWPEKTCSVMSRRIRPRGFASRDKSTLLDSVKDELLTADAVLAEKHAIDASARHGAAFVFTSRGDIGEPEIVFSVRSALSATAIRDPRSRRVLAALEIADGVWNMWLDGKVLVIGRDQNQWGVISELTMTPGRVYCVPYIFGESLESPFGRSRITRPVMALTDMAVRVMLRQEVSAEFFSAPQRFMLGATEEMFTGPNGELRTGWENILGRLLAVPDPEDDLGERHRVQVGQFAQQSMQPHSDHLRTVAMMFSGETSIPAGYLGILHDNPASADAINASEADLVSIAEEQLPSYSAARVDLARNVAALLAGEYTESMAKDLSKLTSLWRSPSTPTQAATADATLKRVTAFPWMADSDVALEDMGYDGPTLERLKSDRARAQVNTLLGSLSDRMDAAGNDAEVGAVAGRRTEDSPSSAEDAQTFKAKFDALGVAVRAGVDPENAASLLGLSGIKFTGAVPVSLRMPTDESAGLEER
ncbi:hypothetical protein M2390_003245 [Mycetocola sp. BIGb0189]|nr:hypothetical protein [Mycetocola sp. BIGb0189]